MYEEKLVLPVRLRTVASVRDVSVELGGSKRNRCKCFVEGETRREVTDTSVPTKREPNDRIFGIRWLSGCVKTFALAKHIPFEGTDVRLYTKLCTGT